jgi:hypothetical protein
MKRLMLFLQKGLIQSDLKIFASDVKFLVERPQRVSTLMRS